MHGILHTPFKLLITAYTRSRFRPPWHLKVCTNTSLTLLLVNIILFHFYRVGEMPCTPKMPLQQNLDPGTIIKN